MRALIWTFLATTACGTEQATPDWAFTVTVSNVEETCRDMINVVVNTSYQAVEKEDMCSCDDQGVSCLEDLTRSSETFSYELFFDGDAVAIEIDGQPFASGTVLGCELEYESPTWLATTSKGDVQWSVKSHYVQADGAGVCQINNEYNFLGVEEYTVVESDNLNYPPGRVVRKVISGHAKAVGGE